MRLFEKQSKKAAKKRLSACIGKDRAICASEKMRRELEEVIRKYAVPNERLKIEIIKRKNDIYCIAASISVTAVTM